MNRRIYKQTLDNVAKYPILLLSVLVFLISCAEEQTSGAVDVRWDREICERCRMAIGDRHFSAQVRAGAKEQYRVYKFDDLGCAVIWLDQQVWKDRPDVELWVTEQKSGKWINAKTAKFSINNISPMGYGLGARESSDSELYNFQQAVKHIYEVEKKYNTHQGVPHPEPPVIEVKR